MLKRLELAGFKSFHQKTALDFPSGISVIVGPNGSGKSNIIDALRWLLGEREAKNIRGAKTEDLIFSGTDKKARVGMARAALYLDNSGRILPLDFSEVAIARKIYRDGTAEYFLNQSRVRLKDLIDFFARSGMGAKGFSIISQGGSDAFIKAAPEERREMMEEILGLRQYQLKKREAELKLAGASQNLEKAEAAVGELLPHLRLLRRQADKWEKRAVFARELAGLENNYFALKISNLETDRDKFGSALRTLNEQINQKNKELKSLENDIKKVETRKPADAAGANRHFSLQRELGQLEGQLRFLAADQRLAINSQELLGLIKKIQRQIKKVLEITSPAFARGRDRNDEVDVIAMRSPKVTDAAISLLKDIDRQISNVFSGESGGPANEKKIIEDRINSLKKEIVAAEGEEEKNRRLAESFNNNFRDAFTAAADKREEIRQLDAKKNQLFLEKDRWQDRWRDLEEKMRQAGRQLADFHNIVIAGNPPVIASPVIAGRGNPPVNFEQAEERMMKLRSELAMIGEIDQELIKEAGETEERYQFLSAQTEDSRKAATDLQTLIRELDDKVKNDFAGYLAEINRGLDRHFKLLFGGGRAKLVISRDTRPEDGAGADHGVNIEAAVPGKGIKNLNAMSGGEKSLLAIAILFSLISINPPPFLVFDEIDAALDEHNSRRFVNLLKKFAEKTQFVIVTHNRLVMEAADALYGVTMDGNGVSKVLSLKLEMNK